MKLIVIMMVFDCADVILGALQSVDGKVDEIRCFYGRWGNIPTSKERDKTKELIEQFSHGSKSKVFFTELKDGLSETNARTQAISSVKNGDWIFVLDSDEVVTNWVRPELCGDGYRIFWENSEFTVCRFFQKKEEMKYFHKDKLYTTEYMRTNFPLCGISIKHIKRGKFKVRASEYSQGPHP